MKTRRILCLFAVSVFVAACGGGGDGGPAQPPAAATAIPLASAMASVINQDRTGSMTIAGTVTASGQTFNVSGSGTYAENTVPGAFEGSQGLKKHIVLSGSVSVSGTSAPLTSVSDAYFDASFRPLGSIADGGYCVSTSVTTLPATAQVGASGTWYAQDCFSSSAKLAKVGAGVTTYSVEADGANSALVRISTRVTDTAGNSLPSTATYRVTSSGTVTRLQDTTTVSLNGVTIDLTITHQ